MSGRMTNLPQPRDRWVERRIHELVLQQEIDAQMLEVIIAEAVRKLGALCFPLGFPAPGHDETTAMALLQQLHPLIRLDLWYDRARELAEAAA